jgi:hypothetical protein
MIMNTPIAIYPDLKQGQQLQVRAKLQLQYPDSNLHEELDFLCPIVFDDYSISEHSKQTLIKMLQL